MIWGWKLELLTIASCLLSHNWNNSIGESLRMFFFSCEKALKFNSRVTWDAVRGCLYPADLSTYFEGKL